MEPDLTVTREIAASPSEVFAALTDVTRMGEWSPETISAEWDGASTGPKVGARFIGHNRNGDKEWSVPAVVVDLVEHERFFFDCVSSRGTTFAKWGYTMEPSDAGCRVTEYWQDVRSDDIKARSMEISGVTDRHAHNQVGMEKTLARLAAALES